MGILIPSSIDLKTFACGILTLLITMLYLASRKKKQPKGPLPPGPSGWPWVGVIPDIVAAGGLAKKFCEWAEQYGDWTYFELGSRPVLVLSSIEAVRETWVRRGDVLSARPATFLTDVIMKQRGMFDVQSVNFYLATEKNFLNDRRHVYFHPHTILVITR